MAAGAGADGSSGGGGGGLLRRAAARVVGRVGGRLRWLLTSYAAVVPCILLADAALVLLIVARVRYTEIDWRAYMEEVEPWILRGEADYAKLNGHTGPLVYPAGFVHLYAALYRLTIGGVDVPTAQHIFALFYLATLACVLGIYWSTAPMRRDAHSALLRLQPALLVLLSASKRVHSIFVLRLFNDGPAMLLLYASVLCFTRRRWTIGCIFFTLAFSIKMNIVLFAPGLLVLLLVHKGLSGAIVHIVLCGVVQLVLGAPFLAASPFAYITRAFNVGRVFTHKWSVNFKWVPCTPLPPDRMELLRDCEGVFTSVTFGAGLMLLMVVLLLLFADRCWCARFGGLRAILKRACAGEVGNFTSHEIAAVLFSSNFIGVVCARSLHFQFYVWYFHSLPFLVLRCTRLPLVVCAALLMGIEASWNPWKGETSSVASSLLLTACHVLLLAALWDGLKGGRGAGNGPWAELAPETAKKEE